jgi:hypothetical protein
MDQLKEDTLKMQDETEAITKNSLKDKIQLEEQIKVLQFQMATSTTSSETKVVPMEVKVEKKETNGTTDGSVPQEVEQKFKDLETLCDHRNTGSNL